MGISFLLFPRLTLTPCFSSNFSFWEYHTSLQSGKEAQSLPGVGAKIAKKIDEFLSTGKLSKLENIHADPKAQAIQLYVSNCYQQYSSTWKTSSDRLNLLRGDLLRGDLLNILPRLLSLFSTQFVYTCNSIGLRVLSVLDQLLQANSSNR